MPFHSLSDVFEHTATLPVDVRKSLLGLKCAALRADLDAVPSNVPEYRHTRARRTVPRKSRPRKEAAFRLIPRIRLLLSRSFLHWLEVLIVELAEGPEHAAGDQIKITGVGAGFVVVTDGGA